MPNQEITGLALFFYTKILIFSSEWVNICLKVVESGREWFKVVASDHKNGK